MVIHGLVVTNVDLLKIPQIKFEEVKPIDEEITNDTVQKWKQIYKMFPNDKKARCSIQYITDAFSKNKLRNISPLVDLYNCASLVSLSPFGGEDVSSLNDELKLTIADGTENFTPLGKNTTELPKQGELIWVDGCNQVVCRSLNWLESDLHKITEHSQNLVFISEQPIVDLPSPSYGLDILAENLDFISHKIVKFELNQSANEFII